MLFKRIDAPQIMKKLSNVRVASKIYLDDVKQEERLGISGKSTGTFGRSWFLLPKGKALFKVFEWPHVKDNAVYPYKLSMVNELLCSRLAQQIGLPCAQYDVAYFGDYGGVVTYNLVKDNEQVKNMMRYHFGVFLDDLKDYKAIGYDLDDQEIFDNVFKGIVFQFLTMQTDAKPDSYIFAVDSVKRTLRFAGLCDNEFAFNMSMLRNEDYVKKVFENGLDPFDIVAGFNSRISFRSIIFDDEKNNFDYFSRMREMCNFAKANPRAKEILSGILSSLDVDKAFEDMAKLDGVEVDKTYHDYVKSIVEFGVAQTRNELDNPEQT